jgi:hypothetical protein
VVDDLAGAVVVSLQQQAGHGQQGHRVEPQPAGRAEADRRAQLPGHPGEQLAVG